MQSQLQPSFQRVEQALQRLADSIAAYNPDVRAAEELAAADEAVSDDLKQLVTHQRNHQRIQELRRQTDAHDAEIKTRIRNISDTRKALANIPAYSASTSSTAREIDVDELLRHAKYISKSTVPPTLPKQDPKPPATPVVKQEDSQPPQQQQLTNGTSTPPPPPDPTQPSDQQQQQIAPKPEPSEAKYMSQGQRVWIGQQLPFEAWPEHWTIQSGALGAIQRMVEAGRDPAGVLSKEEQAEVERRRAEEDERERREMEEREARWNAGGGRRRQTVEEEVFNPDEI